VLTCLRLSKRPGRSGLRAAGGGRCGDTGEAGVRCRSAPIRIEQGSRVPADDCDSLRFDLHVPQDAPFDALVERCRIAGSLGFRGVHVADHSGDPRDLDGQWLDCWTVLAGLALRTERIRIGTLVSNPIIRHPVLLANEAIAVDRLSGGRLELGIGTGIAKFDHAAMGSEPWSPAERAARFAEYVAIVDGVLRSSAREFAFQGRFYRTAAAPTVPGPLQRPRPPITVGGQAPTVRRVAAERADCWNTHGPFGRSAEEIVAITRRQNRELDEACERLGRNPTAVRRSVLLFGPLDPWSAGVDPARLVQDFCDAGVREFVLFWPPCGDGEQLERVARRLMAMAA
jgi:alkanesulfonate monooxygenase SsuD/methylene tetrahydromethanopterin reductase-like flavin-dependent oxidoreductase (luciferase family)